jgi:suppressor for copper-sensitivity B
LLFFVFSNSFAAISDWQNHESKGVKTRLINSIYFDEKGEKKLIAAVEFQISDGWKIYGKNLSEGGIGVEPSFTIINPKIIDKKIIWPQAELIEEKILDQTLSYNAYHNRVIIPFELIADNFDELDKLDLSLNFGLCKDVCIPVEQSFSAAILPNQDNDAVALIEEFYQEKFYQKEVSEGKNIDQKLTTQSERKMQSSIFYWILIAIAGGAILNLMPCVLPVLSIKLFSILKHSDSEISRIRFAFFSTILGIIFSFGFLSIIAILIKLAGNSFGWGLQFQNPYYLILLTFILAFFAANMLGFFEISFDQFLLNFLNSKISDAEGRKNIFIPNFLSGVLAVMLATPCSAPLLGSAITFALTEKIIDILLIFISIGIGFALPYFILILKPEMVKMLPKPGEWMNKIKKFFAFLIILTIFWLIFVLKNNIGLWQALMILAISIAAILTFKIKNKKVKICLLSALLASSLFLPTFTKSENSEIKNKISDKIWIEFDEKLIPQFVSEGKVVFVDITADWCLTCKVNKINVLNSSEFKEFTLVNEVILMRADITKPNKEAMIFIKKYNRFAIPFNAVFGPNAKEGLLTQELLTKNEVFELINKAK